MGTQYCKEQNLHYLSEESEMPKTGTGEAIAGRDKSSCVAYIYIRGGLRMGREGKNSNRPLIQEVCRCH